MVLQFVVLPLRCSGGTYHCPPDPAYVYCPFIYHVICRIRSTPTVGGTLLGFSLQINFDREFFRVLCSRTVVRRDHSNKRLNSPIVWRRPISLMQKMGMTFGGMPLSRKRVAFVSLLIDGLVGQRGEKEACGLSRDPLPHDL